MRRVNIQAAFLGEGGDSDDRDGPRRRMVLQLADSIKSGDVRQLKVHQDQIGLVLASEGKHRPALSGGNGVVAMSLEDIPQELHVERVVLDDQDPFRRRL